MECNSRLLSASTLLCTYSLRAMGDTTLAATRDVLAAISSVGKMDLLMILMAAFVLVLDALGLASVDVASTNNDFTSSNRAAVV